ncbi:TPA: hypothetical protein ACHJX8_004251 [Yersinia enterocolitica]|uniref:hypothetical protein n=1 Tax=Yersinia frederiksenii TaxID=29484 RepID=UPI000B4917EB|nr:hypothetical protein [Yersinia frederiksenii]OWF71157.1 hypothetical protein B4902_19610 [Yersinia frederiksenii]
MTNPSRHIINSNAMVLLHEIYGINDHIRRIRDEWLGREFDAHHGFCDADNPVFDDGLERQASAKVSTFTNTILSAKLLTEFV